MSLVDVLISVPTRGTIRWETVTALEAARDYMGEGTAPILYQPGNLSVAMTRNRIVKRFLETDYTMLAMVDDDIAPPINFVEMLRPHLGEYAMVSLPHPAPHPADPSVMCLTVYDESPGEGYRPKGLWQGINDADAVATGCVLISRTALEELGPAPFRVSADPDATVTSDDFLFCQDLKAAGFKVGAVWEGRPIDHFHVASLAPIAESQLQGVSS